MTVLEGFLARGDRRCAKVIQKAYEKGCIFDAWSEFFHYGHWQEAFKDTGLDADFYTMRERTEDERFRSEKVTPNCRAQCSGCGANVYQGGVCIESKS